MATPPPLLLVGGGSGALNMSASATTLNIAGEMGLNCNPCGNSFD